MEKKYVLGTIAIIAVIISLFFIPKKEQQEEKIESTKLVTTVLKVTESKLTVQDAQNVIYTFDTETTNAKIGDQLLIEYTGLLNKSTEIQQDSVVTSTTVENKTKEEIPKTWQDEGIFKEYYNAAYKKLQTMSLDEKIGQILLVRYPNSNQVSELQKYHLGGYVFFQKDFDKKSEGEVKNMINELQQASTIPILTAVDEEGGKVIRVSSNPLLVSTPFKSSQDLYIEGGFTSIKNDTINKSAVLRNLGLNVNLAPVVDVATDPDAYIYERTFGQDTALTSTYSKTVIESSKKTHVSYTLKHFPGYGNNSDTHQTTATDTRTLEMLKTNDLPPFEAGIESGAEAVLVSHNTLTNIDSNNPSSLSPTIHNILRNDLKFTGIIMTDDLAMGATANIDNATVKAILAGNDLIITTDYQQSISEIKTAINNGSIDETMIDKLAFRNLAWKYYKGLMYENEK